MSLEVAGRWSARTAVAVTVKDLMSAPVMTVAPDDRLHLADGLMSLYGLRHLPVVDRRGLVGMLTERDILGRIAVDTRATLKALHVNEVMSGLVTIGVEASLQEAAEKLQKHRVDCLPVLEDEILVGIVTTSDLLRAIAGPASVADAGAWKDNASAAASYPASGG